MKITIVSYAGLKDIIGGELDITLPDNAKISDLVTRLQEDYPQGAKLIDSCRIARNNAFIEGDLPLDDGSKIHFLPPPSGG